MDLVFIQIKQSLTFSQTQYSLLQNDVKNSKTPKVSICKHDFRFFFGSYTINTTSFLNAKINEMRAMKNVNIPNQ